MMTNPLWKTPWLMMLLIIIVSIIGFDAFIIGNRPYRRDFIIEKWDNGEEEPELHLMLRIRVLDGTYEFSFHYWMKTSSESYYIYVRVLTYTFYWRWSTPAATN